MKNKGFAPVIILLLIAFTTLFGVWFYKTQVEMNPFLIIPSFLTESASPTACTMEAKLCPDGSSVGRSGPKCEFAACPPTSPSNQNISNWNTYSDKALGLEFKYPSNWYSQVGGKISNKQGFGNMTSFFVEGSDADFSTYNHGGTDLFTLYTSDYVEYLQKVPSFYKKSQEITVDGKKAINTNEGLIIIKLSKEKLLNIEAKISSSYPDRIDQILSTFIFTK